jgi:hypothetical protein
MLDCERGKLLNFERITSIETAGVRLAATLTAALFR